jgi:hypothetical protein
MDIMFFRRWNASARLEVAGPRVGSYSKKWTGYLCRRGARLSTLSLNYAFMLQSLSISFYMSLSARRLTTDSGSPTLRSSAPTRIRQDVVLMLPSRLSSTSLDGRSKMANTHNYASSIDNEASGSSIRVNMTVCIIVWTAKMNACEFYGSLCARVGSTERSRVWRANSTALAVFVKKLNQTPVQQIKPLTWWRLQLYYIPSKIGVVGD